MMLENAVIRLYSLIVPVLFAIAFSYALIKYIIRALGIRPGTRFLRKTFLSPLLSRKKRERNVKARIFLHIAAAFLISRILIWLIAFIGCFINGDAEIFLLNQIKVWSQWDAGHYLGIAENGYTTLGDARFHIVFYPLYPYLVRIMTFGILSYEISAFVVSNLCLILSACFLGKLSLDTYGERNAVMSIWLFMFCPAAVFFSIPYTESLFFLLTISAAYFARKHRFAPAILLASLSAFTRLPGAVSAVFVFFEMLRKDASEYRKKEISLTSYDFYKKAFTRFLLSCIILSGFAAYLLVNKSVTGSAFTFLKYQKEHWGQQVGSLSKTASYTITYAFRPFVEWYRFGIYVPQSVILLSVPLILLLSMKKTNPADLAYGIVYYYMTAIPTMLLSGTRYLCCMYCLYPMISLIGEKNRYARYSLYLMNFLFFVYGSYMYGAKGIFL